MNASFLAAHAGVVLEFTTGCLFLHAATAKVLHPEPALGAIRALGVPERRWLLQGLVGLEGALGLGLCAGWRLEAVVPVAILSLTVFTAALVTLRARGYEGDCGCGGVSDLLPLAPELRNVLLMAGLVATALLRPDVASATRSATRPGPAALAFVTVVVASVLMDARRHRFLARQWEA